MTAAAHLRTALSGNAQTGSVSLVVSLGSRKHLFIDDALLEEQQKKNSRDENG